MFKKKEKRIINILCFTMLFFTMQNATARQQAFAKDALELIKAMQSLIPNYEERRRDGYEGYYEGTRLQELHMVKSWLNGICILQHSILFYSSMLEIGLSSDTFVLKRIHP